MTRSLGLFVLAAVTLVACNQPSPPSKDETRTPTVTSVAMPAASAPATSTTTPTGNAMTVYDFTLDTIDGKPRSLGDFRGKVLLLVNTASECGYTPQYEGLQKLQEKYEKRGFTVIGFPSNDYGGQEPGSNAEIKTFCSTKFHVTFPMFGKITVKGDQKAPLYAMLTQTAPAGEVKWNFSKFLVGKDGKVLSRYDSKVTPESDELTTAIEKALGN